ncbi:MAG: SufB/SufD family protein [Bacilli bacterium]
MKKIEVLDKFKFLNEIKENVLIEEVSKNEINIIIKSNKKINICFKKESNYYNKINFIIKAFTEVYLYDVDNRLINSDCQYNYLLEEGSFLEVNKFYYYKEVKEKIIIDLKGYNSSLIYNLGTITSFKQKYHLVINHDYSKTKSLINLRGVTKEEAELEMTIDAYVKKGKKDCETKQTSKIITMNNNKVILNPNLYIDEYLVLAKHGASIGKFDEEQLFYLQTRGLSLPECYRLLIKGFLLSVLTLNQTQREMVLKTLNDW